MVTNAVMTGIGDDAETPHERISRSYDCWKADFDTYCMDMRLSHSYDAQLFTPFKTATLAMYRAAHVALNIEILDLQIFAGAPHILGKPVMAKDYERSQRIIRNWTVSEATRPAVGKAAWHASRILRDAIMNLDEGEFTDLFHYPWCLYLACLTCWAFNTCVSTSTRGVNQVAWHGQKSDPKSEMTALVIGMTSCHNIDELSRQAGSYRTHGMLSLIAKQLSSVRWSVIREGTKVLEGLARKSPSNA